MSATYKPNAYNSVSPYLIVDNAAEMIDFLKAVFGAEEVQRMTAPDTGRIRHAEVRIDDTIVMMGDSIEGWPAVATHVHVYVPDVDATYQRAIGNGAESVQEPLKGEDADKRGGIRDASGTTWWIATRQD